MQLEGSWKKISCSLPFGKSPGIYVWIEKPQVTRTCRMLSKKSSFLRAPGWPSQSSVFCSRHNLQVLGWSPESSGAPCSGERLLRPQHLPLPMRTLSLSQIHKNLGGKKVFTWWLGVILPLVQAIPGDYPGQETAGLAGSGHAHISYACYLWH